MPKTFAQQHGLRMARLGASALKMLRSILKPFVWILVSSTSIVNKRLAKHKHSANLSMDELSQALELTSDAIQEDAGQYITKIEGDYNNVVGLPVCELKKYLK